MNVPAKIAYGAIGWLLWPMSRIAVELKQLGVAGIEGFGLGELLPEDANLEENLKSTGVEFVGAYFGASLVQPERLARELEDFRTAVAQVARLGGKVISVGGGRVLPGRERESWPLLLHGVHALARIAREHGVTLGFHPHDGTLVFKKPDVDRFLAETDPSLVSLTFDTAHYAEAGMDICVEIEKQFHRVAHVHLKDVKGKDFVELGAGTLPLEPFLRILHQGGYAGWHTIELDATLTPQASAVQSVSHLQGLLARIG